MSDGRYNMCLSSEPAVFWVFWLSLSSLNPLCVSGTCVRRIYLKSIRHVCQVTLQGWGTRHPKTFALLRDSHPCQVTVTAWEGLLSPQMVLSRWDNIVSWVGFAGSFLVLNCPWKVQSLGKEGFRELAAGPGGCLPVDLAGCGVSLGLGKLLRELTI